MNLVGDCLWCDHPTGPAPTHLPNPRKITDSQLATLHRLHNEREMTVADLAEQVHTKLGFASAESADKAIRKGWERLDLPAMTRRQQTAKRKESHEEMRKRRARIARLCTALNSKGEACARMAMRHSDFCHTHDPARADRIRAHAAAMRAKAA